ncbi:MAG: hypothetical protein P1U40_11550 [Coxiellaceae bacterium]|nr:hypothetical protein [Coxiellaceae bacterium]
MLAGFFQHNTNAINNSTASGKDNFDVLEQLGNGWLLPVLLLTMASIPLAITLKIVINQRLAAHRAAQQNYRLISDTIPIPTTPTQLA